MAELHGQGDWDDEVDQREGDREAEVDRIAVQLGAIVARYLTALAPGSYLVISHVTDELAPDRMHAITAEYAKRGTVFVGRSKEAIQRMFNGTELVDPGVVIISYWRPDSGQPDYNADRVWGYCGVARV